MAIVRVSTIALVLLCAVLAAPLFGQTPDEKEVMAYRLSMEKVQKLADAFRNLVKVAENDPALYAKIRKAEKDAPAAAGKVDVSAVVRKFEAGGPKIMGAVTSTGLTPREFVVCNIAFLQAAMANAFFKGKLDKLPLTIPRENVEFVQKNEKEIESIMSEIRSLSKRLEATAEDDDDDDDDN
ncbi:MAG: hypothetical protein ACK5AZ_17910 [Bryobacteraceae bacterium]